MRRRNWLWLLLAIGGGLLFLLTLFFYFFGHRPYRIVPTALQPGPRGEINILIIGKDARALNPAQDQGGKTRIPRQKDAHSDIVIVCHINLNLCRVSLLAIPRDLLVIVPGVTSAQSNTDFNQMEKITHTYAMGGEPLLRRTVEHLLGIKIHRSIAFDFDTFRMMFRLLRSIIGPIKIGTHGLQDPTQALKFVRQRNGLPYDDLDRCRNTLNFIYTILLRTWRFVGTRFGDMLIDQTLKIVGSDTDFTAEEIKQLAGELRNKRFNPVDTRRAVLVSEGRPVTLDRYAMTLSCYLPIYPEMEKQIEHYLFDRDDISAMDFMTQQAYHWPEYMTVDYDLLPDYHHDTLRRQELVRKILNLSP
ncbi:MAG: LCP family protein [candidate division WOR-3 bacterium]